MQSESGIAAARATAKSSLAVEEVATAASHEAMELLVEMIREGNEVLAMTKRTVERKKWTRYGSS
jgi:hypothetical protein